MSILYTVGKYSFGALAKLVFGLIEPARLTSAQGHHTTMLAFSWRTVSAALCLLAGVGLIAANIYGEGVSNRHPKAIDFKPSVLDPVSLSAQEATDRLDALTRTWNSLPFDERMLRTTNIISAGIVNYWPEENETTLI